MWPCTTNAVSGIDFTLFMTSDALTTIPMFNSGTPGGALRSPASDGTWTTTSAIDVTGDVIGLLRVPTSMRAAFELLIRVFPEQIRALHQRQNWQLLRDGFCLRAPSVVPQGIGYPTTGPTTTPDDSDGDFVREDIPIQTGMGLWDSNGDFHYFTSDDPRLSSTYRTHKEYARNPWLDAMSSSTKHQVRRMLEGWKSIVDERNRIGMYVPMFVVPAAVTHDAPTSKQIPRTLYFGQFYHRSIPQPTVAAPPQQHSSSGRYGHHNHQSHNQSSSGQPASAANNNNSSNWKRRRQDGDR